MRPARKVGLPGFGEVGQRLADDLALLPAAKLLFALRETELGRMLDRLRGGGQ